MKTVAATTSPEPHAPLPGSLASGGAAAPAGTAARDPRAASGNTTEQARPKARELLPDGSYRRLQPDAVQVRTRSQERFLEIAAQNTNRRLHESPDGEAAVTKPPLLEQHPRQRQTA